MSHKKKTRAGLAGELIFLARLPRQHAESLVASGELLCAFQNHPASNQSASFSLTSDFRADNYERGLIATMTGELVDLFDNIGEGGGGGIDGITIKVDGNVVHSKATEIGFSGPDKSVAVLPDGVNVRIPGLVFAPSLGVTFRGGPFNNQSQAEKGYEAAAINIGWGSNDPVEAPITLYDQLTLGGVAITLDAGASVASGGSYTPALPISEAQEGAGVSVRLHSAVATETRTAGLTWLYRVYFGTSVNPTLDETEIEALASSRLQGSRATTYSLNAGADAYKWVCYPTAFGYAGPLVNFFDNATNLNVPMQEPITVSVTNAYGHTANYYAYRTTNKVNGALTIRIS